MNKLAKGILLAFGVVVALVLLILLSVNLYVESAGAQSRLEEELSRELRMPVKVSRVKFSFFKGLQLDGFEVAASEQALKISPESPSFISAHEISGRLEWSSLLTRRMVVKDVLIDSPTVVWVQTRKGRWDLPKREKPPKAELEEKPEPKEEPKEPTGPKEPKRKKLEFKIAAARLVNANFRFVDRKGNTVARFEGVNFDCPTFVLHEAKGIAKIDRMILQERLVVEKISTPVSFIDGRLELLDFDARLASGTLGGAFRLQPLEEGAPFTLDFTFDGVDLQKLLSQTAPQEEVSRRSEGTLRGSLNLYGKAGDKKSIGGIGQAVMKGGRMEQNSLLQVMGQALQIDELTRLELQRAQLDCRIGDERVYVDSLVADSQNLSLTGEGDVRFNGDLDLAAGLIVNSKITKQLPKWINANFRPVDGGEGRVLNFKVTGTLSKPETDLMGVLVGERHERQLMDLYRAFRAVTTGKKKPDKKKDRKEEKSKTAPSATPTPEDH